MIVVRGFVSRPISVCLLIALVFLACSYCSPVSYNDDLKNQKALQDQTTPAIYNDRFKLTMDVEAIPQNNASRYRNQHFRPVSHSQMSRILSKEKLGRQMGQLKPTFNAKAVMPGDLTMKQSDDDDDDDDDGGEYDSIEYDKKKMAMKKDRLGPCKPQDSMPMMIIREVDMLAVQVPVAAKEQKPPKAKSISKGCNSSSGGGDGGDWGEWSPCSQPCGPGLQRRSRLRPGSVESETQYRHCNNHDCDGDPKDMQRQQRQRQQSVPSLKFD